jgi:MFS transporter, NNP family, nitrate/nitrite transporter
LSARRGNAGAVPAGFLFKTSSLTYPQAFLILGVIIAACCPLALMLRFTERDELATKREMEERLAKSMSTALPA